MLGLWILASVVACTPVVRATGEPVGQAASAAADGPAAGQTSAVTAKLMLTAQAFGKVTFGMHLADAEKLLGEKAPALGEGTGENADCRSVSFKAYPQWRFMVEHGVVTRADAYAADHFPQAENALGVHFGDSLEAVRARHPTVRVQSHKYDPTGHYLIFLSDDAKSAIVMEEGGGKITAIRGGLEPSVEYVEGCF